MEELNQTVLQEGLFASLKGHLFEKRALGQSRGAGGG